ncbi:MAG: DUF4375 domain-containing protein [Clostridia bacterium]|nr:DUF4375 domain-containing protein [Clostridia bacterium]
MKKWIVSMLMLGISVTLCGCGIYFLKNGINRYLYVSEEKLAALSDAELYEAVMDRTEHIVDRVLMAGGEWEEGVNALNEPQKLVYSLNWLELEVNNGGIVQFFSNSSGMTAPFISEYLSLIGAYEHQKLYDDFILNNDIDVNDLSPFHIDDISEFLKLYEKYPSDIFDDAWYELDSLERYLVQYIREHLADF